MATATPLPWTALGVRGSRGSLQSKLSSYHKATRPVSYASGQACTEPTERQGLPLAKQIPLKSQAPLPKTSHTRSTQKLGKTRAWTQTSQSTSDGGARDGFCTNGELSL